MSQLDKSWKNESIIGLEKRHKDVVWKTIENQWKWDERREKVKVEG